MDETVANNNQTTKTGGITGKGFQKGQSGNPTGRPKAPKEFSELAKNKSVDALKTLIELMENMKTKANDRIKAAEIVIAYGVGKPLQQVDLSSSDGTFKVQVEYIDTK
jgi:hypothetical protein